MDAIWISPFYPSPMADYGYDVSDYCDVHPELGTLETFDRLVSEAHKRGIRIIVDYVPNHTSNEHAWFIEARNSKENPRRDWYIWKDAQPDGSPPNNWGSIFGGSAWEWDEKTQQYYFHQFLKEQPDLNWRNPEVPDALKKVLQFWMDRGVDGFRMDVVGMIYKHPDMPDQPLNPSPPPNLRPNDFYSPQIHLYDQDQDEVYEMVKEFNQLTDSYGDICLIGEVLWHSEDRWLKYYGPNGDGLHLPMNFSFMELPWEASHFQEAILKLETILPDYAWPSFVLGNHDVPRLASRYGQAQASVAAMMLLTLRGTPILYYGDEIGLENGIISDENIQDPWGIIVGPEYNRDICRTPMQWDSSAQAGFSSSKPWLPISQDYLTRNVANQNQEKNSLLNFYRALLWYRKSSLPLKLGGIEILDSTPGCFAYIRRHQSEAVLVAINFTSNAIEVTTPSPGIQVLSSKFLRINTPITETFTLHPHEGVIIEIRP
ncbi:MAG: alpha-amylase [Anaerolineae bacterium]|nr:alpha-amylase [Anaerolineae bacterium]